MVFDLIRKDNSNELRDAGKDQISMQSFFVLCTPACKAEIFLYMMNVSFYSSPYFIRIVPFLRTTEGAGIRAEILFGINVYHSAGW